MKRNLSRITFGACVCMAILFTFPVAADDNPSRVLVIYNLDYPDENGNQVGDSEELAIYYMESRGVPWQNMLGLHCKTGTYYSQSEWSDFWNEIVVPVQERLQLLGKDNILFMMTCYGVPFTVAVGGDHSTRSIDNALMNIYNLGNETAPVFPYFWNGNPYLENSPSIAPDVPHFNHTYQLYNEYIFPVTRLDGDTVAHAKAMVAGALYGEKYIDAAPGMYNGIGYVDTRYGQYSDTELEDYPYGYNSYATADKCMAYGKYFVENAEYELKWEPSGLEIGETGALYHDGSNGEIAPDALWYGGWYNYSNYHDVFEWKVGSVACDLNSDSGAGVRSPESNWRFLAQALARGVTAGAGVTGEPYLTGHPRPEVLLHFILNGYNYAEAAFASNPALSWRVILYGDPLYNPTKVKTPVPDTVAPPIPEVDDFPPTGYGDVQRMITVDIDAGIIDPDLVVARVEYGETPGFGSLVDYGVIYQIHHEILLESLTPDTDYYYQVTVRDPAGLESSAAVMMFHTQADGTPLPTETPTEIPTFTPSPTIVASPSVTPSTTATPTPEPVNIPTTSPLGLSIILAACALLLIRFPKNRR